MKFRFPANWLITPAYVLLIKPRTLSWFFFFDPEVQLLSVNSIFNVSMTLSPWLIFMIRESNPGSVIQSERESCLGENSCRAQDFRLSPLRSSRLRFLAGNLNAIRTSPFFGTDVFRMRCVESISSKRKRV